MRQKLQLVIAGARAFMIKFERRSQRDLLAIHRRDFEFLILRLIVFPALVIAQLSCIRNYDTIARLPGRRRLFQRQAGLARQRFGFEPRKRGLFHGAVHADFAQALDPRAQFGRVQRAIDFLIRNYDFGRDICGNRFRHAADFKIAVVLYHQVVGL